MSNYPFWWDTTITIYNKHEDPLTQLITWTRTVVPNCFWKGTGGKVSIGGVMMETDSISCRIPASDDYMDKLDWENLTDYERVDYFTLGVGDIIVKGDIDDIIDEYVQGHRSNDLLNKYQAYQKCLVIKTFVINDGMGRNNRHYNVKGV